jgi:hypothetical protein
MYHGYRYSNEIRFAPSCQNRPNSRLDTLHSHFEPERAELLKSCRRLIPYSTVQYRSCTMFHYNFRVLELYFHASFWNKIGFMVRHFHCR